MYPLISFVDTENVCDALENDLILYLNLLHCLAHVDLYLSNTHSVMFFGG